MAAKVIHHRLGGSTAKRYFNCAISIPATEKARAQGKIPKDNVSSQPARRGTASHTLGEKCLETGCDPIQYLGTVIKVEGEKFTVDHKMIDNVTFYVDMCRDQYGQVNGEFEAIEFNSELGHLFNGEDVGGPCDYVCFGSGILVILDYKNGVYGVEVENNPQFLKYALGMYEHLKGRFNIHTIRLGVCQPNYNHEDGPCRTVDYTVKDLMRWKRRELRPAVARVVIATDLMLAGEPLPPELGPNASSDWCNFCPVNGLCEEYANHNTQMMLAEFNEDDEIELPDHNTLTIDEAEKLLNAETSIKKWFEGLRSYRKQSLQAGNKSKQFKLVESKGNREYKSEHRSLRKLRKLLKNDLIFKTVLESPAQIEKILARNTSLTLKQAKAFIDNITIRPTRGVTMVSIKDSRPDITLTAIEDFAGDIKKARTRSKKTRNRKTRK